MNGQKPFEGDTYIKGELLKLKERFNLTTCVETGTQYGNTAAELYTMFDKVHTIELDEDYHRQTIVTHGHLNMSFWKGDSLFIIAAIKEDNVLYYLDAHGCNVGGCALKGELDAISLKKLKNVCIAIHDFKVPGKDFGYDTYDFELCFEEIESHLNNIYPDGFDYHYNDQADGAYRGIIYIYPKQK